MADVIEKQRKEVRTLKKKPIQIHFVKEGETTRGNIMNNTKSGILDQARDWQLDVDLDRKLRFPEIVPTNLRPDIVLWSATMKKIIIIELTVPWEESCGEANERKRAKYDELMTECRGKGWQTWSFLVEVGCRGFPAQSVWRLFSAVTGVTGRCRRTTAQRMDQAAEQSYPAGFG